MNKRFLIFVALLSSILYATAGPKEYVAYRIVKDPSILEEPIFWGVIAFIGVCVIIYLFIKDKDNK